MRIILAVPNHGEMKQWHDVTMASEIFGNGKQPNNNDGVDGNDDMATA